MTFVDDIVLLGEASRTNAANICNVLEIFVKDRAIGLMLVSQLW